MFDLDPMIVDTPTA